MNIIMFRLYFQFEARNYSNESYLSILKIPLWWIIYETICLVNSTPMSGIIQIMGSGQFVSIMLYIYNTRCTFSTLIWYGCRVLWWFLEEDLQLNNLNSISYLITISKVSLPNTNMLQLFLRNECLLGLFWMIQCWPSTTYHFLHVSFTLNISWYFSPQNSEKMPHSSPVCL